MKDMQSLWNNDKILSYISYIFKQLANSHFNVEGLMFIGICEALKNTKYKNQTSKLPPHAFIFL